MKALLAGLALMAVSGCAAIPEGVRAVFGEDCRGDVQDAIDTCRADAEDAAADAVGRALDELR